MKLFLCALTVFCFATGLAQQHDLKPADAMKQLAFLEGNWSGKQVFNSDTPMSGDAVNHIEWAIGGRYLAERLSTTLPGRNPSDTRHFIGYDPATGHFKAWWFTDTTSGPMELEGTLEGRKLVLLSKPLASGNVLRATYEVNAEGKLVYTLEMKAGTDWQRLFTSTYSKVR